MMQVYRDIERPKARSESLQKLSQQPCTSSEPAASVAENTPEQVDTPTLATSLKPAVVHWKTAFAILACDNFPTA